MDYTQNWRAYFGMLKSGCTWCWPARRRQRGPLAPFPPGSWPAPWRACARRFQPGPRRLYIYIYIYIHGASARGRPAAFTAQACAVNCNAIFSPSFNACGPSSLGLRVPTPRHSDCPDSEDRWIPIPRRQRSTWAPNHHGDLSEEAQDEAGTNGKS